MKIANLSVYKLLGYLLLGIGAGDIISDRIFERTKLQAKKQRLEAYRGKVRRVKILGQTDRSITAEVTLDIWDGR